MLLERESNSYFHLYCAIRSTRALDRAQVDPWSGGGQGRSRDDEGRRWNEPTPPTARLPSTLLQFLQLNGLIGAFAFFWNDAAFHGFFKWSL